MLLIFWFIMLLPLCTSVQIKPSYIYHTQVSKPVNTVLYVAHTVVTLLIAGLPKAVFQEHSLSGECGVTLVIFVGVKINYGKDFSFHLNLLILSQNWFYVCNSAFLMHPDPHVYLLRMKFHS